MESVSSKAVFLSYASQDAEAARKLADALCAAGVEVWFDQSELRGGDAWDQKIRMQVQACALFLPVISANTQTRLEGYFRIEWNLAAQRTHAMAAARPFLIPAVIDATRDAEAHVPPEFKAVQWTRLPNGETTEAYVQRVQALLASGLVAGTPDLATTRGVLAEERPGDRLGHYQLVEKIGEGGCGTVWQAEQEHPVRRRVALKVVKLGMDTKEVVGRFEAERQALALMDHPNIAKVFDAGITETGRPYFVMELVRGVTITTFCDERKLSTEARLNLFMQVCHAVQHAHQKGIIHRDIKPSNILVALHDDLPVPKVIDFGIAKATAGRLTDQTFFTAVDQFIGTPAYMSPEQAQFSVIDIDTRSDIYSLGVLLYELLVGRTPFDTAELLNVGLDEMRRHIREVDPPRPSMRLSTLQGDALSTTAQRRQIAVPKLLSLVRGDLDWIVMRCLEKDRARRYETANGLASDVARHLHSEPISACPPSTAYRVGKFIRRHKVGVAACTTVALALLVGMVGTSVGLLRATRAEARARQSSAASQQVTEFMLELFKVSDPSEARGNSVTAREILDKGSERIKKSLAGQPATQALLMDTMGRVYQSLGLYDRAAPLFEHALSQRRQLLGKNHPDVAASLNNLGALRRDQGDYAAAERLLREALGLRRPALGPNHPDVARTLDTLGTVHHWKGDYAAAEQLFREALRIKRQALGNDDLAICGVLNNLAMTLNEQGQYASSEPLYREALEIRRRRMGNDNPEVARSLNNLGMFYFRRNNYAAAEPLFREALEINRRMFGERHPEVCAALNNLALVLRETGAYAQAEELFRSALEMRRELLGPDHPQVVTGLTNLGSLLTRMQRFTEAEALLRESLRVQGKTFPEGHWEFATLRSHLGECLAAAGRREAAEPLLLDAHAVLERQFGNRHPRTRAVLRRLVALYEGWSRPAQAAEWQKKLDVFNAAESPAALRK